MAMLFYEVVDKRSTNSVHRPFFSRERGGGGGRGGRGGRHAEELGGAEGGAAVWKVPVAGWTVEEGGGHINECKRSSMNDGCVIFIKQSIATKGCSTPAALPCFPTEASTYLIRLAPAARPKKPARCPGVGTKKPRHVRVATVNSMTTIASRRPGKMSI